MVIQGVLKRSKQREEIIAFLQTRKDHPTADTVYQEIKNSIPNISLGTVYRNLALLAERGQITRLTCDGKADRFDADTNPHYHFICKKCGCVQDILIPYDQQINQRAEQTFEGTIIHHTLLFEGYCRECNML